MAKQLSISGETITRDDGSTVHCVAYRDANGDLLGKAYVPKGATVTVPEAVEDYVIITDSTTLSDHLPDTAIGDIPDPAETAMAKLEKLDVPDDSPM